MTVKKLIDKLLEISDAGFSDEEVKMLCCDDNPIQGEYVDINNVYLITRHGDKNVNGVYLDGTV